jgi:hypothetical protein
LFILGQTSPSKLQVFPLFSVKVEFSERGSDRFKILTFWTTDCSTVQTEEVCSIIISKMASFQLVLESRTWDVSKLERWSIAKNFIEERGGLIEYSSSLKTDHFWMNQSQWMLFKLYTNLWNQANYIKREELECSRADKVWQRHTNTKRVCHWEWVVKKPTTDEQIEVIYWLKTQLELRELSISSSMTVKLRQVEVKLSETKIPDFMT